MNNVKFITRFGPPSSLDQLPQGTVCLVQHGQKEDVFIQYGTQEENPQWVFIGTFPIGTYSKN